MTTCERRQVVERVRAARGISQRSAIRYTGFLSSTMRYRSVRPEQREIRARLRELALERPGWGYHLLYDLLRREHPGINHKRVSRLYREESLAVRQKRKKRRSQARRIVRTPLTRPDMRWSLDFVHDTLSCGRRFRCLTVLDECHRESPVIHVAHSLPASEVVAVLERLRLERGLPERIITDNGSEFTSRAFDAWAYARGIQLEFIQPGKPVQNCFTESFTAPR